MLGFQDSTDSFRETINYLGLATQSTVALLILGWVCGIAYSYRIHLEEPALMRELGEVQAIHGQNKAADSLRLTGNTLIVQIPPPASFPS